MGTGLRTAFLVSVFVWASAGFAFAQTTAVIVPGATVEGTTPAAPAKPLDILDTDYPLESLLGNEEGKIQLSFIVNARGQVAAVRVRTPTKLTRLVQQAANVARRWQFTPAMRDGEPVAEQVNIDVDWKLPLEPVYEYQMLAEDRPVEGQAVDLKLPVPTTSQAMTKDDYPRGAAALGRRGVVILKFLVREDGSVGDVDVIHKAFTSLDEAAIKVVKNRWKFQPAQLNGKPVSFWQYATLSFTLPGERFGDKVCTSEPQLSESGSPGLASYSYRVAPDGLIADAILSTRNGWMRMSKPVVQQFGQQLKFRSASLDNRPTICWLRGTFPLPIGYDSPDADPVALTTVDVPSSEIARSSLKRGESRSVKFRLFVRDDGAVGDVEILEPSGDKVLDGLVVEYHRKWRFRPAVRDGKPIGVWLNDSIKFTDYRGTVQDGLIMILD